MASRKARLRRFCRLLIFLQSAHAQFPPSSQPRLRPAGLHMTPLSRLKTVGVCSSREGKLGGGVTYELHYRSRAGQDWILVPTKTPNKILTGLVPGQLYDFKVRALNCAGLGEFSPTVDLQMPSERRRDGDEASEATD